MAHASSPHSHTLLQDCIAYAFTNQPNTVSRELGKYDWRAANGWLLSLATVGATRSASSRAEEGGAAGPHTLTRQRHTPRSTFPTPPAQPPQPALPQQPPQHALALGHPVGWLLPRGDKEEGRAISPVLGWAGTLRGPRSI